jgi:hypothetical protein
MIEILHFKKGAKTIKLNQQNAGEIRTQKRTTLLVNKEMCTVSVVFPLFYSTPV